MSNNRPGPGLTPQQIGVVAIIRKSAKLSKARGLSASEAIREAAEELRRRGLDDEANNHGLIAWIVGQEYSSPSD